MSAILGIGVVAFVFAILGLTRPNIAIPGAILGPPSVYTIYHDGIWMFIQIVGILLSIFIICCVLDFFLNKPQPHN